MTKDEVYNLRWDSELKARVQKYAKEHDYEDMASLIREAIKEKIDPSKEQNKMLLQEEIRQGIMQALRDDPSLLHDSLQRIGIQLYAKKSTEW